MNTKKIPQGEFWARVISVENTVSGNKQAIGKKYKFVISHEYKRYAKKGIALMYVEREDGERGGFPNTVISSEDVVIGNILNG